jgi:hypothetical protein
MGSDNCRYGREEEEGKSKKLKGKRIFYFLLFTFYLTTASVI